MKAISEILSGMQTPAETGARASSRPTTTATSDDGDRWIWSNDERVADLPDTPAPVPCEFCGAMRYHKGFKFGDRIIWPPYGAERCTCPQAVKAYEEEKAAKAAEEAARAEAQADVDAMEDAAAAGTAEEAPGVELPDAEVTEAVEAAE